VLEEIGGGLVDERVFVFGFVHFFYCMPVWIKTLSRAEASTPIDGRPRFVKRSIDDGEKVKIAAIDPDFV